MMNPIIQKYKSWALSTWRFKWVMLNKLPSLVFWGISVKSLSQDHCEVVLPFSYTTQNPFRSIYFGALSGASELATGALLQMLLSANFSHSMLVTHFEASFTKKATTAIVFTCNQGPEILEVLNSLQHAGDSTSMVLYATGRNSHGEEVMRGSITWAIRRK